MDENISLSQHPSYDWRHDFKASYWELLELNQRLIEEFEQHSTERNEMLVMIEMEKKRACLVPKWKDSQIIEHLK